MKTQKVAQLYPVTVGRPAYAISCASYQLVDWMSELSGKLVGSVRPHLRDIQALDFPSLAGELDAGQTWTLILNARLAPTHSNFRRVRAWFDKIKHIPDEHQMARASMDGWSVAVGLIPTKVLLAKTNPDLANCVEQYCSAGTSEVEKLDLGVSLFAYPHDIVRENMSEFSENLGYRVERGLAAGNYQEVSEGVFLGHQAKLNDYCVTDSSNGPIVIEENTTIGPFSVLAGPIFIGANSRVNEYTSVKDCVSLGHTTKMGGEIEASIVESYSNKQHHGFLGHSYLGSWINLGAGTCNSDLKNTYGHVNMVYQGERVATDMQFVGCFMGDYAKTAINTSIFTGKTIGACSMLYGFVSTNVPSYVNYARSFGQISELVPQVMISTQQRMFQRRLVQQRNCDIQLLKDMYELTRHERQLSDEPLSL